MKNYTPARQELKRLGWNRTDRAIGPNKSVELWMPPSNNIGMQPIPVSFKRACISAIIELTEEDIDESPRSNVG